MKNVHVCVHVCYLFLCSYICFNFLEMYNLSDNKLIYYTLIHNSSTKTYLLSLQFACGLCTMHLSRADRRFFLCSSMMALWQAIALLVVCGLIECSKCTFIAIHPFLYIKHLADVAFKHDTLNRM